MGINNLQYYPLSLILSLSFVLLLSLKTQAAGYLKFNLSFSSGIGGGRPYYAHIFLGTPTQEIMLGIDMGSDLVRFPCGMKEDETMPPAKTRIDTMPRGVNISNSIVGNLIYNIAESSTFLPVLCNSTGLCPPQFQENRPDCSNETYCILPSDIPERSDMYYMNMDNLTMSEDFSPFTFACDLYDISRGVLGLSRMETSFFEQFGMMYDNCLSYCLPLDTDSTGYLAFGRENGQCPGNDNSVKLIMSNLSVNSDYKSSYVISITSITVNDYQISINQSESSILVNPGTYFTSLPMGVYEVKRNTTLELGNTIYTGDGDDGIGLDLCFDTSNGAQLNIPNITMTFGNKVTVELPELGIIYNDGAYPNIVCLGFKGNNDPNSPSVFGGMQQAHLGVGIDVANEMVGFRPNCALIYNNV